MMLRDTLHPDPQQFPGPELAKGYLQAFELKLSSAWALHQLQANAFGRHRVAVSVVRDARRSHETKRPMKKPRSW